MRGPVLAVGPALLLSAVLAASCAVVEPPPGGPRDLTPPFLVSVQPDSGATGVGETRTLRLVFSEKMDRVSATGWLYFFPDQRIRKTKWHGAIEAEIELDAPLPPDTVIVVEVARRMADAHKLQSRRARHFPIATGDSIPTGRIAGVLVMGDSAVSRGVIELYDVPPDTLEYFQQPLLRRTSTGADGAFVFEWLPVPGGPWLVRAFVDENGDFRPAPAESKRLLPDTLRLTPARPDGSAGVTTMYDTQTPGRLRIPPFPQFGRARPILAWAMYVGEVDTGWHPQPVADSRNPFFYVDPDSGGVLAEMRAGLNRIGFCLDVDGDSTFSVISRAALDSAARGFAWSLTDSSADTSGWYLEPRFVADAPLIEPGLASVLAVPDSAVTVTPWPTPPPPPPALPDTAAVDSLAGANADTLGTAAPDTTNPQEEP